MLTGKCRPRPCGFTHTHIHTYTTPTCENITHSLIKQQGGNLQRHRVRDTQRKRVRVKKEECLWEHMKRFNRITQLQTIRVRQSECVSGCVCVCVSAIRLLNLLDPPLNARISSDDDPSTLFSLCAQMCDSLCHIYSTFERCFVLEKCG